jgi:hypothetical protein
MSKNGSKPFMRDSLSIADMCNIALYQTVKRLD